MVLEKLWMVGIDEQTPVAVRERYACLSVPWPLGGVEEMVILSTCQRREVYLVGDREVVSLIEKTFFPDFPKEHVLLRFSEEAVIRRLFRVACGVESLAVGENQVLGQVRRSWELAREQGRCGKFLNRLFLQAITLGKKVRRETDFGRASLSIGALAIQFAERFLGDLQDKRVFLVGTGEMAQLLIRYLLERQVGEIRVSSKNSERARCLQRRFPGIQVFPYGEKYERMKGCEMLVSATEAPHYTVECSSFRKVFPEAPHFLLDLGVPRNIDPEIGKLEGVRLFTLEDLRNIAGENRHRRLQELNQVERFIDEAVAAFRFSLHWNTMVQVLQKDFREITQEELRRLFGTPSFLPESQRIPVEEALERINRRFFAHLKDCLRDGGWKHERESCPGR